MQTDQSPQDLLTIDTEPVRAETGKRFLNYIIDMVVFYLLLIIVFAFLFVANPSLREAMTSDKLDLLTRAIAIIFYALYMSIIEAVFKGKSLGKLITKTRAVNLDGTVISTKTAFLRGFSRAVPFCAFSALGTPCNPWQDRWTDTLVADERKTAY